MHYLIFILWIGFMLILIGKSIIAYQSLKRVLKRNQQPTS